MTLIKILRQRGDQVGARRRAPPARPARQRAAREARGVRRGRAALRARRRSRGGDRGVARDRRCTTMTDRPALDELARLYRVGGHTHRADRGARSRGARSTSLAEDEKPLRVEIAQLESDGPRAVSAWQAVLDLDPDDLDALSALEAAYARAGDWMAVSDIQTRRLDARAVDGGQGRDPRRDGAHSPSTSAARSTTRSRAGTRRSMSMRRYQPAYDELERLLDRRPAAAHDLVELLEKRAELHAALGDGGGEIAALARAADVWEGQLDNPDAAGEILEKILAREPGSVAALTRLSKIYERAGDWDKCKATLEQALRLDADRAATPPICSSGSARSRAIGDSDDDTAILHFQQALKHDASHARGDRARSRSSRAIGATARCSPTCSQRRVATIDAADGARGAARRARGARAQGGPHRRRARGARRRPPRRRARRRARARARSPICTSPPNRLDEAAPIYDRLAEEAKAARRMKDVARFRQRQGGILEARGDRPGALAAYEEALRVNPTDVTTMTGPRPAVLRRRGLGEGAPDLPVARAPEHRRRGRGHEGRGLLGARQDPPPARPAAEGQEHVPARPRARAAEPEAPGRAARARLRDREAIPSPSRRGRRLRRTSRSTERGSIKCSHALSGGVSARPR